MFNLLEFLGFNCNNNGDAELRLFQTDNGSMTAATVIFIIATQTNYGIIGIHMYDDIIDLRSKAMASTERRKKYTYLVSDDCDE